MRECVAGPRAVPCSRPYRHRRAVRWALRNGRGGRAARRPGASSLTPDFAIDRLPATPPAETERNPPNQPACNDPAAPKGRATSAPQLRRLQAKAAAAPTSQSRAGHAPHRPFRGPAARYLGRLTSGLGLLARATGPGELLMGRRGGRPLRACDSSLLLICHGHRRRPPRGVAKGARPTPAGRGIDEWVDVRMRLRRWPS